jgi:hypothetical protein
MLEDKIDAGLRLQQTLGYWEARQHMMYYKAIFQFVSVVGYQARSLIDVGSGGDTGYVQWMGWIPERAVLDFAIPNKPAGITAIETDFFTFDPPELYDVALCCQVLEHIPDPQAFCTKLRQIARHLIVTVPYKWGVGTPGHIHDPVDEHKLATWMQVPPNSWQIVQEPFREGRLLAYYNLIEGPSAHFDKEFIFRAIAERASFAP